MQLDVLETRGYATVSSVRFSLPVAGLLLVERATAPVLVFVLKVVVVHLFCLLCQLGLLITLNVESVSAVDCLDSRLCS